MIKKRRLAESQAPPLQLNQFLPYPKDHLLLDRNVDTRIVRPSTQLSKQPLRNFRCSDTYDKEINVYGASTSRRASKNFSGLGTCIGVSYQFQ